MMDSIWLVNQIWTIIYPAEDSLSVVLTYERNVADAITNRKPLQVAFTLIPLFYLLSSLTTHRTSSAI